MSTSRRQLGKKFKLGVKLGSGAFGEVFYGTNTESGENVAIKLEKTNVKHLQLKYESKVYKVLEGGVGVPNLYWFGSEGGHNILVTDLLGRSLEDWFDTHSKKFNALTVLMCGKQMVKRMEYMHSRHFIHRDIKPDNFMSGRGEANEGTIYVIDFGLSKRFRHPKTLKHMAYREGKSLTGTPRYASINNHLGVEQSRRDDMESIGYVLVYLAKGKLPWQGLKANTKKLKYQKIMDKKMTEPLDRLCKNIPKEIKSYNEYCRSLRFEDKPNYTYLSGLFSKALDEKKYGDEADGFIWQKKTKKPESEDEGTTAVKPSHVSKRLDMLKARKSRGAEKNISTFNNVSYLENETASPSLPGSPSPRRSAGIRRSRKVNSQGQSDEQPPPRPKGGVRRNVSKRLEA